MQERINIMLQQKQCTLRFVTGNTVQNEPFYSFIFVRNDLLDDFEKALSSSDTDLSKWGAVIAQGPGHEPPKEIIEAIDNFAVDKLQ